MFSIVTSSTSLALTVSSMFHESVSSTVSSSSDAIISVAVSVTFASGSPNAGRFTVTTAKLFAGCPTVTTPGLSEDHVASTPPTSNVGTVKLPVMFEGSEINPFKVSYAPWSVACAGSTVSRSSHATKPNTSANDATNKSNFFIRFSLFLFFINS